MVVVAVAVVCCIGLGPVGICVRVMMFIRKCTKTVPGQLIVFLFVRLLLLFGFVLVVVVVVVAVAVVVSCIGLGPVGICVRVMIFIRKCTKTVPGQLIVFLFVWLLFFVLFWWWWWLLMLLFAVVVVAAVVVS